MATPNVVAEATRFKLGKKRGTEGVRASQTMKDISGVEGDIPAGEGWLGGIAKKAGPFLGPLMALMIAHRGAQLFSDVGQNRLQRQAMESQARMATPENLYYQAAAPQAQEEEEQARQALMSHLAGGVLGPTLARGERRIGG